MLGAVLLAVATGVGTALAITGGRDDAPQAGSSTEAVARPWDRPPGPGVPPPPFPCVRPDVAGTPVRKGPPPDDPPVTVPAGWVWPADTGGFRIALPAGWLQLRSGDTTCFQDPGTRRILGVEPYPGGDPVGRLKSSERDLTSAGRLPHYQKVRLESDGPGAAWGAAGPRRTGNGCVRCASCPASGPAGRSAGPPPTPTGPPPPSSSPSSARASARSGPPVPRADAARRTPLPQWTVRLMLRCRTG
ncbi:hypothetical protein V2I01_00205 [Micromonospora sp. BRA006-A]|nr:hypothetical protein [Micromonospora sp. BRA006-A]